MNAEQQLLQKIQQFVDGIDDQIAVLDLTGLIIIVNVSWMSFAKEIRHDPKEFGIGVNYLDVLQEEGRPLPTEIVQEVIYEKTVYQQTYSYQIGDENRWYKMSVSPVVNDKDETYAVMVRHIDITDVVEYKNEVYEVLESITDGFLGISEDHTFFYVNDRAAEILQMDTEELLGRDYFEVFPDLEGTKFADGFYRAVDDKETVRMEEYYPRLDAWYQVHFYPRQRGGCSIYFQNIDERKRTEEQLRFSAYYDELTHLSNRKYLDQAIDDMIERASTQGQTFAVLFVDLNDFKRINDLYSHAEGDLLLEEMAKRLKNFLGSEHFIARFGGDEFVVLIENRDGKAGHNREMFSKLLLREIQRPIQIADNEHTVSASIGISYFPDDGETKGDLLRAADTAMYSAKRIKTKGDEVKTYEKQMHTDLSYRVKLLEDFSAALENDDIYFVVQPQVEMDTGKIIGAEFLTRWLHPEFGMISPMTFIPIAEESGLMTPLTEKLLDQVMTSLTVWQNDDGYKGSVALNLPTALLSNRTFMEQILYWIDEYKIPKGSLEVEITESVQLFSTLNTQDHLAMLKEAGVLISIDDFGTDYSNFSYLMQLPVDKVKIDRSFVRQIGVDQRSEDVLEALILLSEKLGYACLAEGVETEEQRDFLVNKGCRFAQGYFYFKPMNITSFSEQLSSK
ncbi:sensor domain-containing protein [Texcoconibacillus texcoconensis]|uniref:Diguanylate cyclase (GGDEF)-like protein/PAS domain S-box-containing protein n=1 Tax=Texcoconibacillus texcoconensis TaxID=1095777 RepID=A0A840QQ04_9BACI|nr:EAL domain-containing protein [Texcoconibacillus texcoconensis]MBB5173397.1 diguanylate cyclase (GGDEF)-like protein/PAS domain S-box-containing protein [Texcoconibacillus texcoconensis]